MDKRLCYVEGNFAYFTSNFEKQWGDDWGDSPYEHNAGEPYENYEITKIAFDCDLETPAEIAGINSSYSVKEINDRKTPWLKGKVYYQESIKYSKTVSIFAGITQDEFIKEIHEIGGNIYTILKKHN